jgi:RHS repeat-associated protein
MDRLIQTNFPDNGQISTCFSEVSGSSCNQSNYPLQVQTSQKITSTMSKVTTALLDGLARVSETQLNSDPDCTASGGTKVDTTYDGDEHKSTVTNPYCTTSDATYGVTTYQYDGLDRVTKVIPPDGTSTSNNVASSYDSLPIVGLPVNNCTIVTDQVGNQRRSCSDALGRLMEVDEPSDVVGATPGSGSVTITGSERYYLYTYTCGPNGQTCQTNIPDVGNVSITVNGVSATVSYGSNSTPAIIASALATAVNNGALPVTASVNGSVVTLTATTTGAATNYSLTASSATTDTTYFTGTSFPATPSGSILTGGTDGSQGNGSLSINSPAVTLYQYDVLNNLLRVDQKGNQPPDSTKWRTRTFAYNSLSQLLCAANPEITPVGTTCPNPDNGAYTPGTVRYAYDNEGNLITKTSPAPNQLSSSVTVQTAYTYKDPDNRLTQKSYNDGLTPTASFAYDGNTPTNCTTSPPAQSDPYPLGRRTSMCDVSGGTSWSHDPMGRIANEKRTIVGTSNITNTTTYAPYNLDGSVQTITYPGTGTVITYLYSKAGRAISGEDNGNSNDYAYSATYAPFGGLTALTMGTAPIKLANAYNNRLQPLLISASAGSTIMSLCYDFHSGIAYASCLFPAYTSGNNGNIFQIVNGRDSNRTQNFNYDALNRIANAYTNGTNWGESFTIDAWGNLTNRGPYSGKTNYESLSASATGQNQLTGFGYDAAGNMTSNNGAGYTYDAENHLVFTGGYAYFYDGDGNRVKKCTSSAAFSCQSSPSGTLYWRGAGGDQLLESSLAGASQEEYIFFNGKRIARRDVAGSMVHYYFSDHLGTHSIVTDQNGDMPPQYESDFYPYGGEIPITTGDPNHYKFTGKERDTESGLDNFGARFDASSLGRFMTLDPVIVARGRMVDPQQLNRYAYVRNNPVRWIDPTGEILMCNGATAEAKCYCYHYLEEILGNAAALLSIDPNMLSMDPNTGRISFDTSGINLSTNEGAALINDLVQSPHTYGLSIGPKVDTVGGLTDVDEILNLPPTEDQLRHGSPTPTETPVGVEDQVAFNPNPRRERISLRGLKLAVPYTLVFHELAEAYAKVDGGMKTYEGAHNAAAAREDKLRDERPYLKVFNPGSGGRTNEPSYQGVLGVIKDR